MVCRKLSDYLDFPLKTGERFNFLLFRGLIVHVHRRFDVTMSHDFLDDFDIRLILTEPCAKGVPKVVDREVWKIVLFRNVQFCHKGSLFL